MEKYKLIKLSDYLGFFEEKQLFKESNELHDQLNSLSKVKRAKVEEFLEVLRESGLDIDDGGYLKHKSFAEKLFVLPYILWCISGRQRPEFYSEFLELLKTISIPKKLLCTKLSQYASKGKKGKK